MAQPAGGAGGSSGFLAFLPLIIMFAILYFLIIRPQQKKQKDQKNMLDSIKQSDKVITVGGIHGTVVSVRDDIISVKIANNVTVEINRTSVSRKK